MKILNLFFAAAQSPVSIEKLEIRVKIKKSWRNHYSIIGIKGLSSCPFVWASQNTLWISRDDRYTSYFKPTKEVE